MSNFIERISLEIKIIDIIDFDSYLKAEILIYKDKALMHIFSSLANILLFNIEKNGCIKNFGQKILCRNVVLDDKKVELNFQNTNFTNHGFVVESSNSFVWFQLDYIQYSYNYDTDSNFAKFRLNKEGVKMIQDYYSLSRNNKKEDIIILPKRKDIQTHKILEATCFPKFILECTETKNSESFSVEKIPVLEWAGRISNVENIIKYNSWICLLASLFYHLDINIVKGVIYIDGIKTVIRRFINSQPYKENNLFSYFIGLHNIYYFLENISFHEFRKKNKFLNSIIHRYLQSTLLNGSTKYLVLYNIMEQCQQKKDIEKFQNLDVIKEAYLASINYVKPYVKDSEINDFQNRWESVWNFLQEKPYKGSLADFLNNNNVDVDKLNENISVMLDGKFNDFRRIRNKIAHGSNIFVPEEINNILSFIDLILILNKLNCTINISNVLKYSDIYKE